MTVYPFIINLGPLEITGYGIMLMVGFLVGGWLAGRQLRELGLREDYAGDMVVAAVIGGVVGAKVWYVVLTQDLGALFSRGGMVWYGGFIGGALAVILNSWRLRVPVRWTAQIGAAPLAAAYALGRVGCFLVGDDYGRPTGQPWGIRFPEGLPPTTAGNLRQLFGIDIPASVPADAVLAVHPTQLYEVALMLGVFAVLWRLRKATGGTGWLFGLYLALAGAERFVIEILRAKDDRFFGPFTVAQLTSVLLVATGITLFAMWRRAGTVDPGPYLGSRAPVERKKKAA